MAEPQSVGGISFGINVELSKYTSDIDKAIDKLDQLAKDAERDIEKVESVVEESMKAVTSDTNQAVNTITNEVVTTAAVLNTAADVITQDLEIVEGSLVEVANTAETQLEKVEQSVTDAATTIQAKTPNLKLDKNGRLRDENDRFVKTVESDLENVEDAVENAADKIEDEMHKIDNVIERAAQSASKELSHFQKIANSINLQAVGNGIRSFGSSLASIGTYLSVGVTAPLIGAGVAAFKFAGDIEQLQISLEVLLGSASDAKRLLSEWKTFSATTPFQMSDITKSGKMLLAFGESSEEVTETLRKLGNVSSALGIPLNELAMIYGKSRTMGTAYTQDLMEMAGRGIPIFEVLAKEMGFLGEDGPEQIKKLASEAKISFKDIEQAFVAMNDPAKGFGMGGMMERQSQSAFGKLSTALDNLTALAAKIGEVLIPPITEVIDYITVLAESFMKYLTPEISRFIVIAGMVVAAAGPMLVLFGTLIGSVGGLVAGIGALIAAGPAIMGFFTAVSGALASVGIVPIAIIAGLTAIIAVVGVLAASTIDWSAAFEYVKDVALDVFKKIAGFLYNFRDNYSRITKYMKENWDEVVTDMIAYIVQLPLKAAMVAIKAFTTIQTIGKRVMIIFFGWLSNQFMRLFESIWNGDFVKYAFLGIGKLISSAAQMGKEFFLSFFTGASSAKDFQAGFEGNLGQGFRDALEQELASLGEGMSGLLPELTVGMPELNFATPQAIDDAVEQGKKLAEGLSAGIKDGLQMPSAEDMKIFDKITEDASESYKKLIEDRVVERNRKIMEDEAAMEDAFFKIAEEASVAPEKEETYQKPEITVSSFSSSALGVETQYRERQVVLLERIAAAVESSVPSPLSPTTEEAFDFSF